MSFKCELCNYSSRDKFNYTKHLKTNKHKEKVTAKSNETQLILIRNNQNETSIIKYKCDYCNNTCSTSSSLARHKKSCSEKTKAEISYNSELEKLKSTNIELLLKLNEQMNIVNQKEEIISILKSENAHLKSVVNNAGSVIKTSVSTMAYVIKHYKEAPVLEQVNDYSAIHYEQDNTEFIENLIYENNHNKLYIYISEFIIKTYKKEDPSKQSIWNSDTSRLTYLIREIIVNNKVDWKIDKKGIKTTKFIIEPILEYIDTQIRDYIQNFDIDYSAGSAREAERKMLKLKSATDILKSIEDKILSDEILKYIAPYFYLSKNSDLIECT